MAASSSSEISIFGARCEYPLTACEKLSANVGQLPFRKKRGSTSGMRLMMASTRPMNSGPKTTASTSASLRQYSISSEV